MADVYDKEKRSWVMSCVGAKNTKPEILVRKIVHGMGFRFRLHQVELPGKPDMVLPRHKKIIFVHGCFWHGHEGCKRAKRPNSNMEFWNKKIDRNILHDNETIECLERMGWNVLIIWECQTFDIPVLKKILDNFLK